MPGAYVWDQSVLQNIFSVFKGQCNEIVYRGMAVVPMNLHGIMHVCLWTSLIILYQTIQ